MSMSVPMVRLVVTQWQAVQTALVGSPAHAQMGTAETVSPVLTLTNVNRVLMTVMSIAIASTLMAATSVSVTVVSRKKTVTVSMSTSVSTAT